MLYALMHSDFCIGPICKSNLTAFFSPYLQSFWFLIIDLIVAADIWLFLFIFVRLPFGAVSAVCGGFIRAYLVLTMGLK